MKNFKQFLSESVTINGDFNGTLTYGGAPGQEQQKESYFADVVWEGKLYRLELEGQMLSKSELSEQIQSEYPGAMIQNIYPGQQNTSRIKSSKRYQPERLTWSD